MSHPWTPGWDDPGTGQLKPRRIADYEPPATKKGPDPAPGPGTGGCPAGHHGSRPPSNRGDARVYELPLPVEETPAMG